MKYKKRRTYKYNLHSEEQVETGITLTQPFDSPFLSLSEQGLLTIKKGYSWDGASGPAIDTKNILKASLVHDALYQLMREEVLPQSSREQADSFCVKYVLNMACRISELRTSITESEYLADFF
ncbi:hypothetical protein JCM19052_4928 [Vibrio sp. JCM 19052]|nr:hypothetical protein JCM19052_4928 [Vibrio sp. JCM 19052]